MKWFERVLCWIGFHRGHVCRNYGFICFHQECCDEATLLVGPVEEARVVESEIRKRQIRKTLN